MKGGTYHNALEAGFNEKQAGFLGRLGGETREEAVDSVFEKLEEQRRVKAQKRKELRKFLTQLSLCGILGFAAGISIKFALLHL